MTFDLVKIAGEGRTRPRRRAKFCTLWQNRRGVVACLDTPQDKNMATLADIEGDI